MARADDRSTTPDVAVVRAAKDAWRQRLIAARRALPPDVQARRAAALAEGAVRLAAATTGPVCAYFPIGSEPGSPALVEALRDAGHEVWLPVVPSTRGPLDWARFTGVDELEVGVVGMREPSGPRLGPAALAQAGLVLVPALAADRGGVRLGRGAGHYDRSLHLVPPGIPLVVVLNDEELVPELPAEPHDRRVTAALLADVGVAMLGNSS